MELTIWQELFWGWLVITIAPKLLVIPVWHWLNQAIKDTERQDQIDAAWLASLEQPNAGPDGGSDRHPRSKRPRSSGPRRGPGGGGGIVARVAPRPPHRTETRERRVPPTVPSR